MKQFLISLSLLLYTVEAIGQESEEFTDLLNQLSGSQEYDGDYAQLIDIWQNYISQPISLQTLTRENLYAFQFLTGAEVESIMSYLEANKPINSIYELQVIKEIRLSSLPLLAKFIEFPSDPILTSVEGEGEIILTQTRTLEQKQGFISDKANNQFSGNPSSILGRINYGIRGKFRFGVLFENDAGETFKLQPQNQQLGFDHNSYYLKLEKLGPLEELIIGNYSVGFGQGLGIGSNFNLGMNSRPVLSALQVARGIRPFTSSSEYAGMNGLATTTRINNTKITAFASHKRINTNLRNDSISSILTTGLHRTATELSKRKNSVQTDLGLEISQLRKNYKISAHVVRTELSRAYSPPVRPYQEFSFQGKTLHVGGISGTFNIANLMAFGELSTANKSWATIGGLIIALDKRTSLAITARNYSKSYYSFHSGAFGRNSINRNENGVYLGISSQLTSKFKLSGFYDIYRFPWLRFQHDAPGNGVRSNVSSNYKWNNSTISLQLRSEQGIRTDHDRNWDYSKNQLQFSHIYKLGALTLTTKVQYVQLTTGSEREDGVVLLQDIKREWNKFRLIARIAAFNTDSYNTRIYNYENDVRYAFSFPAYYGKGLRTYYLLKYAINRNVDMNFRISKTTFTDRQIIGTGVDKILGNSKSDVKLQVKIKI